LNAIISWATQRPRSVLFAYVVISAIALVGTARLKNEDDLLVFLPTSDPDVTLFKNVSRQFGALHVALIGVDAPAGEDVLSSRIVGEIQTASDALRNLHGVDRVVSLTTLSDVVSGPLGAEVTPLIARPPGSPAEHEALRHKVLSREHVVGNVISADGRAALIMVFLAEGGELHVEDAIRKTATEKLPGVTVYFGGAPFAAKAIYDEAQNDVWHLSPVALLVLLLVVVFAFRDPVGVALTIISVAFSTLVVLGAMGWLHDKFTVATSTLPVILFASGSSYAVHVLGRYYMLRARKSPTESIREAIGIVGPPLAIAAGTTAVGFYSFVTTDVTPMRAFGIACGSGVMLCWLTSLTLVPAVVALWPRPASEHMSIEVLGDWLVATWHWARRQRRAMVIMAIVIAACTVGPMLRVTVRMDPRAFFREGSDPWRADRFLEERFGGSIFMQVAVHGDLDDPATLRQLGRLGDFARAQPGVTQVSSVIGPLSLVDDVMGAGLRLPSTRAQAANLYFFLQGEAGIRELITDDRRAALMVVRMHGNAAPVVAALEKFVRELPRTPAPPDAHAVAERVAWVAQAQNKKVAVEDIERTARVVAEPGDGDLEWTARRARSVDAYLASEEAPPMSDAARAEIAKLAATALSDGSPELRAALVKVAPSPEEGSLAYANLSQRLSDERRRLAVERATPLVMRAASLPVDDARLFAHVGSIVDDLFAHIPPTEHATAPLQAFVSGEPVLDRGFSRSVGDNQVRSLLVTIVVVLLLMFALFRSLKLALLSMTPSMLTMALIFGVMGMLDVPIDLGTSLVAGIATGAGSDFAMHYLWYLRRQGADEVSRTVGPVMVVSIALVSLGFWVLALGKSPVMHLFGTLAGLSMSVSALLTCLLVPAVLNKVDS
jgi:predicted RND superfamily exporter protein